MSQLTFYKDVSHRIRSTGFDMMPKDQSSGVDTDESNLKYMSPYFKKMDSLNV
jgi:hypothetical protein